MRIHITKYKDKQILQIFIIYLMLLSGSLWHSLMVLQETMQLMASPLIISLAVWLAFSHLQSTQAAHSQQTRHSKRYSITFGLWSVVVLLGGFGLEWLGVITGIPFGHYYYSDILAPQIQDVPIAIGFAWLGVAMSSLAIAQRIPLLMRSPDSTWNHIILAGLSAGLMVLFDFFMEPAAIKLGYWFWYTAIPPLQNYIAWFIAGFIFIYSGLKLKLFDSPIPSIGIHMYIAQILYFTIVYFAKQ